jgi:DNA-3-methyladenine glycosylase II
LRNFGERVNHAAVQTFTSTADLETAIRKLGRIEPRFKAVHRAHGTPSLRTAACDLESLLMIVTEQFLSLSAAAAIWQRVKSRLETVSPESLLTLSTEELKSLGLSNAKARTFHAAAEAALKGELDFDSFPHHPDNHIHEKLCALHGIGPWTADIYLLSCLSRTDAWPIGDLALQLAAQDLFALPERPTLRAMLAMAEPWRPYRAAAARLLWSHYRGLKGLKQA